MREAFLCVCGPSPRREPLSRMEVVVQLFFYARRFAVGAFQDRREFLRRPEILVVASFQYFPFFAVFLAHNRRNISARRSLRQAERILRICLILPWPCPPPRFRLVQFSRLMDINRLLRDHARMHSTPQSEAQKKCSPLSLMGGGSDDPTMQ